MRKRSELLIAALQIPVDYVMLVVSFVLAYFLREGTGKPFSAQVGGYAYLNFMLIFLPIWLFIFFSVGLYSLRSDRKNWIDFGKILAACSAGAMVLIVIDFLWVKPIFPAKIVPIYGFLIALVLVSAGRIIMTIIQRLLARRGVGVYSVLFIGDDKAAIELKDTLKKLKYRYKVVSSIKSLSGTTLKQISKIYEQKHIDTIIVADNSYEDEVLTEILTFCQSNHIGYQFMPTMSGMYTSKILSTQIGSIPVLELKRTPIEGWGRIIKRLFDVIMSALVAIITLPIQLIIYIAIKIKEPGPAFYFHECYGRNGRKINVIKFRTMKSEYSLGPKFGGRTIEDVLKKLPAEKAEEFRKTAKIKDDPRVGKLGRFLRKTSLDELPQLYNVLKGDLSLVGPRPLPESELKLLGGEENLARIVTIRPGITGLWQVSGRNDLEYSERVKLNIYYIENWSLWLDVKILFKTVWQAIFERNGI
jgi:exopolysaccharide biosynthesis polyprenyl glycosylphosphotransferase